MESWLGHAPARVIYAVRVLLPKPTGRSAKVNRPHRAEGVEFSFLPPWLPLVPLPAALPTLCFDLSLSNSFSAISYKRRMTSHLLLVVSASSVAMRLWLRRIFSATWRWAMRSGIVGILETICAYSLAKSDACVVEVYTVPNSRARFPALLSCPCPWLAGSLPFVLVEVAWLAPMMLKKNSAS